MPIIETKCGIYSLVYFTISHSDTPIAGLMLNDLEGEPTKGLLQGTCVLPLVLCLSDAPNKS